MTGTLDLLSAGYHPSARTLDILTKVFFAVLLHGDLHFPLGSFAVRVTIWRAKRKSQMLDSDLICPELASDQPKKFSAACWPQAA